jgi:hypothetical protein
MDFRGKLRGWIFGSRPFAIDSPLSSGEALRHLTQNVDSRRRPWGYVLYKVRFSKSVAPQGRVTGKDIEVRNGSSYWVFRGCVSEEGSTSRLIGNVSCPELGVFLLSWIGIAGLVFLASLATEIVQLINNHKATALPVVVVSIVLLLAGSAFIVVMRRVTYWRWKQLEVWLTQLLMK